MRDIVGIMCCKITPLAISAYVKSKISRVVGSHVLVTSIKRHPGIRQKFSGNLNRIIGRAIVHNCQKKRANMDNAWSNWSRHCQTMVNNGLKLSIIVKFGHIMDKMVKT